MVASRRRAAGVCCSAPFWISALCAVLIPTSTGFQDLDALLVRPAGSAQRAREHFIASPFGTIEAATYSFGRPIGTSMPQPPAYQLVNFDPGSPDANVWRIDEPLAHRTAQITYPTVNRRLKGDRLPVTNAPAPANLETVPQLERIEAPAIEPAHEAPPTLPMTPRPKKVEVLEGPMDISPAAVNGAGAAPSTLEANSFSVTSALAPSGDASARAPDEEVIPDLPPEIPPVGQLGTAEAEPSQASLAMFDEDPGVSNAAIYFGAGALGEGSGLQSWAPGAAPVRIDSGIKLAALEGTTGGEGETLADKNDPSRLESPADRLGLAGKSRAKAEKCLADAVYFEARGEPLRGQEAVAQVVMNRVFSGYYPNNVCGVVYQNAHRYLACQFTFACQRKNLSHIGEPEMWEQAKTIAKDTLDGKIWLPEVGHATHYHAYWVHPSWAHEMNKLYRLGVHTFYRPRAWGDGDDAPVWGQAPNVSKAKPEAAVSSPAAVTAEPTARL